MDNLTINNVVITTDSEGRYSLNDLHRAAGSKKKHKPALFMQNSSLKKMVELLKVGNPTFNPLVRKSGRYGGGTWVCKELVYKYAMWIDVEFELKVIQTFDAVIDNAKAPASMIAFNELTKKIEEDKHVASVCGKELNNYKRIKKENKEELIGMINELQLKFGF